MCRKQAGIAIGRLCDKCDGKCPVCDSYVRPTTLVRICDECSFGNYQNKCVVCGGEGISDAFYCFECTRLEKDRDGCPKIINLGSSRTDVSFLSVSLSFSKPSFELGTDVCLVYSYSTKRKQIGLGSSDGVARVWAFSSCGKRGMEAYCIVLRVGNLGSPVFWSWWDMLVDISNCSFTARGIKSNRPLLDIFSAV